MLRRAARALIAIGLPLLYAVAVFWATAPRPEPQRPDRVYVQTPPFTVTAKAGPAVLHAPDPIYPAQARRARVQGTVTLEIHIASDGRVARVAVVSGPPLLVPAAVAAVRKWQFEPGEATTEVLVPFHLPDAAEPEPNSNTKTNPTPATGKLRRGGAETSRRKE